MARHKIAPGTAGDVAVIEDKTQTDPTKRYRGLVRVVDVDGREFMVRRWRANKAAAKEATKRAAADKLAALARERTAAAKAEQLADLGDLTTTVADLIGQTMASTDVLAMAPGTISNYRSVAKAMNGSSIAALRPRELDVAAVREFLTEYTTEHGRSSGQMAKAILNRAMDRAVESRKMMVPFNPVSAAKRAVPNVKVRTGVVDHTKTPDETTVVAMLAALRADAYYGPMMESRRRSSPGEAGTAEPNPIDVADLIAFTYGTGTRIGEALALRWSDLHLGDNPRAEITGTVRFISKAAAEAAGMSVSGTVRQERTKTRGSDRDVALGTSLTVQLQQRADVLGVDLDNADDLSRPVFPSPQRHDRFRDPNNATKAVKAAQQAHGITWAATHVARKSFITRMVDKGVPVSKVADAVGHARVEQTLGYLGRGRHLDADVRAALE